jgi:hypothetical protein
MACGRPGKHVCRFGAPRPPPRGYGRIACYLSSSSSCAHSRSPDNSGMGMDRAAAIALPFVGREPYPHTRHGFSHERLVGPYVGAATDSQTLRAGLPRYDVEMGGQSLTEAPCSLCNIYVPMRRIDRAATGRPTGPRVVGPLVGLKGGAHHQVGRSCFVQMGLIVLPQDRKLIRR